MKHKWNKDCKSFPGSYACDIMKAEDYIDCDKCKFYDPCSKKILIIKLGASGDVIRATTLLSALREKYGRDILVKWLVTEYNSELLRGNKLIDKLLIYNQDSLLRLNIEEFDILINLDADNPSTAIANLVKAKKKYGFYMDKYGHPAAFNKEAEYFLEMQFSDVLKKKNKKSSQELFFDIACLPYKKQEYMLKISDKSKKYADEFRKRHKLERNIIGLNMASGIRWPSKRPSTKIIVDLAKKLQKKGYNLLILGGPEEKKFYEFLKNKLHENGVKFTINNLNNSIEEFIGIISICDKVISTDSLAMHISIALNKEIVALFYCTPPWEIENYGKVKKITSRLLEKYFYTDEYIEELVNSISADEVLKGF